MLVLSRGPKDQIVFPNLGISVEILRVSRNRVRVGVEAPPDVKVLRGELSLALNSELHEESQAAHGPKINHRLRNRLNTAHIALNLAQKQLDAGLNDEALGTLHQAIRTFDTIDAELIEKSDKPMQSQNASAPRALVVEDDVNECELLAGYLRLSGFDVDTADDGLKAMVYLSRHERPDIVLMDMHMPRFDGARAVRSIRENPDYRNLRVFAVTGSEPADLEVKIGPQGVDRWFHKPIDPQRLVDQIHEDLGRAKVPVCG